MPVSLSFNKLLLLFVLVCASCIEFAAAGLTKGDHKPSRAGSKNLRNRRLQTTSSCGKGKGKGKGDKRGGTTDDCDDDRDGDGDGIPTDPAVPDRSVLSCSSTTILGDGGTSLSVSLEIGGTFDGTSGGAPVPITIDGQAGITTSVPAAFTHFTYVIDVSDTTSDPCEDGTGRTVLDCSINAIENLNTRIRDSGVAVGVSIVTFSGDATALDLGAGQVVAPASSAGISTALGSLTSGGSTNYMGAVSKAVEVVEMAKTDARVTETVLVFLSDGKPIIPPNPADVAKLAGLGTKAYTFAVGAGSSCSTQFALISQTTGVTCTQVTSPAQLLATLSDFFFPIRFLETVTVRNGSSPFPITVTPTIPAGGLSAAQSPAIVEESGVATIPDTATIICIDATSQEDVASCCIEFTP